MSWRRVQYTSSALMFRLNNSVQVDIREREPPPNLDVVFNPRKSCRLFIALQPHLLNKRAILNNGRLLCIPSRGISTTETQNNGRKHGWASFIPVRQSLFTAFHTENLEIFTETDCRISKFSVFFLFINVFIFWYFGWTNWKVRS